LPYAASLVLGGVSGNRGLSIKAVALLLALLGVSLCGIVAGYLAPHEPLVWVAQLTIALGNAGLFVYGLVRYGRDAAGSKSD